jgi:HSP20 family protein
MRGRTRAVNEMEKSEMTSLIHYYSPLYRDLGAVFGSGNGEADVPNRTIALDVVETPEAYIVKAELPGIPKDRIEVSVEDRDVTIGAEFRDEGTEGKSLWQERRFAKASRAIRLPEAVDANAAQAKHVDGVLQLTLPKIVKPNAKQITIQ